jgi:hypothetical protein
VQVRYDEGIAIHIGPEPCVVTCESGGEASAGERIGQPLSHDSHFISGADAVKRAEGNTSGRAIASVRSARRGRRPWHVSKLLGREPGGPAFGHRRCIAMVRIGKVRSHSR